MEKRIRFILVCLLAVAGLMLVLLPGCELEEDFFEIPRLGPISLTDITSNSLTVNGAITDDGGIPVKEAGLVWSTAEHPTTEENEGMIKAELEPGEFILTVTGLSPATNYHIRAFATNNEGSAYSNLVGFATGGEAPSVITAEVADITYNSAVSGGTVESDGGADVTARGVVWSTSENPSVDDNEGMTEDGEGTGEFTSSIGGLSPETTYYVRAWATNSEGTAYGSNEVFTTESEPVTVEPPAVETAPVTDITYNSAVSGGTVESDGGADVTARGVVWGTSEDPTVEDNAGMTEDGEGTGEFISSIGGLSPVTTYYVRAWATNSEGTAYGSNEVLITESEPVTVELPVVETAPVTDITYNSAVSGGTVESDGGADVTARGVVWGTSEDPTVEDNAGMTEDGEGTGEFISSIGGLSPVTTYYVRAWATNSEGTAYGSIEVFITESETVTVEPPEVATAPVTAITYNTAVSGGTVESDGGADVTARGIVWSTAFSPTVTSNEGMTSDGSGLGEFTSSLVGLSPETKYYVRAYATNSEGTAYGNRESFTTEEDPVSVAGPPVVTTEEVTGITSTSATSGGVVEDDGGADVTARGVVWGTSEDPSVDDNEGMTEDGAGVGKFTSSLVGLSPETTYYVRAYATNSEGTSYGGHEFFTTESEPVTIELPTVSTRLVHSITYNSAVSGGHVHDDGGDPVTDRGIVWSMLENPTVEMYDGITYDGSGTGQFTSNLVNLYGQTTYYVRAWAQNEAGVSYGEQLSFTTYYGIVTDIDLNSYNTVMIDGQEWMAENLRTTSLNNETSIPEVTDNSEWAGATDIAYCWYENYGDKFKDVYGALYNFHAILDGNLCPVGWRVPSREDWNTLIETAGGQSLAGGKLKSTTVHWQDPNAGATNEFRFNALPGGVRPGQDSETASAGEFVFMGEFGIWAAYAFVWDGGGSLYLMHYDQEYVLEGYIEVTAGVSVRCIKGEQGEIEIIGDPPAYIMP